MNWQYYINEATQWVFIFLLLWGFNVKADAVKLLLDLEMKRNSEGRE